MCRVDYLKVGAVSGLSVEHSIKDIMRAEGLPDFRAPPAITKLIDTSTSHQW